MSENPIDITAATLPDDADLTELFLEHASCGGAIDVARSETGTLSVHCSGCGKTVRYALPGVGEAAVAEPTAVTPSVAATAAPAPTPAATTQSFAATPAPTAAPAEVAGGASEVASGASEVASRGGDKRPEPEPGAAAAGHEARTPEFDEGAPALELPQSALSDAVPVTLDSKPPRRHRPWWRRAAPALLGLVFLAVAIVVAGSISGDDQTASSDLTSTPTTPVPDRDPDPGQGSGPGSKGEADSGSGADGAKGGGNSGSKPASPGAGDSKSASGKGSSGGSSKPGNVELNFTTLRGDLRVGLPRDWAQRGVTSNGAIQFAPTDNTVAVQVFYERGSTRTSEQFARRARRFVRERRDGARPAAPVISGNEARIRSPYGGGLELVRTVIDGDVHVMAIATIPNASPEQRGTEAEAVVEGVSGP